AYTNGQSYGFGADLTLYAQWTVITNYTLTYTAGPNGSITGITSQTVTSGANGTSVTAVANSGYHFTQWSNGNLNATRTELDVLGNYSVTAFFVADSHTVTFNANGGSGSMLNETENAPTALTSNNFTNTHFTFTGWNTAANDTGTPYADSADYPFTADNTLYAQWTPTVYTVTFNSAGGIGTMANQTSTIASALTTNIFTRSGYTFTGWNTVVIGGGTSYTDSQIYQFTQDDTLYAQWSAVAPGNHTVTFNGNGSDGGSTAAQTTNVTTNLTSNGFTKTGYTFAGWTVNSDGTGTPYANNAIYGFGADLILNAQWTVRSYNITSNVSGGGGTISPSATVNFGNNATFNITADSNHFISDVIIDANTVNEIDAGVVTSYTFTNVTANHTIVVLFSAYGGSTNGGGFIFNYFAGNGGTISGGSTHYVDNLGNPVKFNGDSLDLNSMDITAV